MTYQHNLLFDNHETAVQKTYRIPRLLVDYIARFAREHACTNTDVVIEALLQFFSGDVIADLKRQMQGTDKGVANPAPEFSAKSLPPSAEKRRLELLHAEFLEYFVGSLEATLQNLQQQEDVAPCTTVSEGLDQKDVQIATLRLLLERSSRILAESTGTK